MSLISVIFVQSLLFALVHSQGSCKQTPNAELTFYGFPDGNSAQTSFSCGSRGLAAGGTGSYSDPESFATAASNSDFQNCDIVYIPYFRKYFQYHDHCVKCDQDFQAGTLHLDLWIGSSTSGSVTCEQDFGSISGQTIIQQPPSDLPVESGALWDGSSCHDASSPNPLVFPNPSSSDLCSGGSSSPNSVSSTGDVSTSTSAVIVSTPTLTPSSSATAETSQAPVESPPPSPSLATISISTPPAIPPTTLLTLTITSSSNVTASSTTSSPTENASNTSDCASWGGCLGDPCQTYNDCAGDWICMGNPKKCVDNRTD